MEAFREYVDLRDEGLPFNIWITEYEALSLRHHWHEFTEILYVLEGEAIQRVNNSSYKITPLDLVIINGLELHSTYTEPNQKARFLVIQLPPSFLSLFYRDTKRYRISNHFCISSTGKELNSQIKECLDEILHELRNKKDGHRYFLAACMYRLLGVLHRDSGIEHFNDKSYIEQKLILERLSPAILYIENNFCHPISLEEVCGQVGLSAQYFCKNFKKATTYTFVEYLNTLRVLYAQNMLANSDISITEAAYSSGFSSISYFNRIFKKITGENPSQFRRK